MPVDDVDAFDGAVELLEPLVFVDPTVLGELVPLVDAADPVIPVELLDAVGVSPLVVAGESAGVPVPPEVGAPEAGEPAAGAVAVNPSAIDGLAVAGATALVAGTGSAVAVVVAGLTAAVVATTGFDAANGVVAFIATGEIAAVSWTGAGVCGWVAVHCWITSAAGLRVQSVLSTPKVSSGLGLPVSRSRVVQMNDGPA